MKCIEVINLKSLSFVYLRYNIFNNHPSPPKDIHILISKNYDYFILHSKWEFADGTELRILKLKDNLVLSGGLNVTTGSL